MMGQPASGSNPPATIGDRRLLCLGGSFNPIHLGHLITARAVAESLGLPGVRLIPAAANPHKAGHDVASASDRLEMCRLAIAGDPFFVVDDLEFHRPPPSYTVDTVERIAGDSSVRVPWLIGTDLLPKLHTWHRFAELIERAELVVMRRAAYPIDVTGLDPRVVAIAERAVTVPQLEISATAVRQRVRAGMPISYLVPMAVVEWIDARSLYREASK